MPISKLQMSFFSVLLFLVWFQGLGMAASGSSSDSRGLDQTPTWAVAVVCTFFILISIVLEKSIHGIGTWLVEKPKKALLEALEKLKSELMVLGFISLLLTFGQTYIVKICLSSKLADSMLPCPHDGANDSSSSEEENHRKLLSLERRYLSSDSTSNSCKAGHEPLVSGDGLHQLHILIFFLAVIHVFYSAIAMILVRLKIRGWKAWEEETSSHDYEFSNDPARFRLTHETSFVRLHANTWAGIPIFFYISCFFRQFYKSVSRTDYQTLRNGFIAVHLSPGSKFNFRKYLKRSMEDDFKVVVGVSPVLWASFVCFLVVNVSGWNTLLWASLIPPIIILAIGTKLQMILSKMANDIIEKHAVVQGIPLVQGSDEYFWFGRPQLVLHLIHFALFQNSFQLTYLLWIWYCFGLQNCFHADYRLAVLKVIIGILVLFLCSYITLPLYALVTQMGSRMKKSIFDEQTKRALKKWRNAVKKKKAGELRKSPIRSAGGSTLVSPKPSSGRSLHRFQTTGHSTRSTSFLPDADADDDLEVQPLHPGSSTTPPHLSIDLDHHHLDDHDHDHEHHSSSSEESGSHSAEETPNFSFVTPEPLEAKKQ
ncbi:MLO-like protein 10 [Senna tora]|uniref:MLO-like protein n=1 Tax=Senna tora TaxID=362788 RepID=A0A834WMQ2_9FABA|nr:MLO-like protein 10 [Senna tora]